MTFNDKIDLFMEKNGYEDLKKLAVDSKIPYTTLRDFYIKKSADNSRVSTIRKLAKFMNCTMDYLTYDEILDPSQAEIKPISEQKTTKNIFNDLEILFSKNKDVLTDRDEEMIRFIVEKSVKEIDKQLGKE